MPRRVVRLRDEVLSADGETLRAGVAAIQAELDVAPEFPPEVEQAAQRAAKSPRLPDLDRTDLPFVTIDPATAMDLDQALHLERNGDGFTVHYAIADVGAFVSPGDPLDEEAHKRGETLYGADSKVPLYPKALSEDAASLLADQVRPALLWTIELDGDGGTVAARVERARVRSRAKLSYEAVQHQLDQGTADPVFTLLKEVGERRLQKEAERGGVSLPLPEQEVRVDGDHWSLAFRQQHPVEQWNAQISLLTGMTAATFMVTAKTGLLRTLAPADPRDVKRLRRTARALRIDWPENQSYPDFIRSLDPATSSHAAMLVACTRLLRGSGYVGFAGELPEHTGHSAIAADYAHVTAPLRRLVDRYAGEICVALSAGDAVPGWVVDRLGELPKTMQGSTRRANQYERAVLDLVEAAVLQGYVGESFDGVVVEVDDRDQRKGDVTIREPAVEAPISDGGDLPLGTDVRARLAAADPRTRTIRFELA
ncbi:RNB domain-containing ribonuclease [Jiangella sp. DSM 45060]|uniref:RNB domain-containing ribonuclease n=1 Tax=Jiangella sp. DSM 45060 TaxID=1798224 RepID=UPI00087DCEB7|nr:RNB domain-containing ribonuclease [Jiangella sp. DSM 45060]SDS96191.1 VacB and RNase II family 3'-5' exoribonucleases [Jiangella sp. DSM 45060]